MIGLVIGLFATLQRTDVYEANMRLLVGPIAAPRSTLDASGLLSLTYAEALESNEIIDRASESIGSEIGREDVRAVANQASRVILLVVRSEDREAPGVAAETLATLLDDLVASRPIPNDDTLDSGRITVLDGASDPMPVQDSGRLVLLFSVIVGLGVGALVSNLWLVRRSRGAEPADISFLGGFGTPAVVAFEGTGDDSTGNASSSWKQVAEQLCAVVGRGAMSRVTAFVLLHDDRELVSIVGRLAAARLDEGDRIELADPDGISLPAGGVDDDDEGVWNLAGVPVRVHQHADSDNVVIRAERVISSLADDVALWLISPEFGESAMTALSCMIADAVVLVVRADALTRTQFDEVRKLLDAIGVVPAALLVVASSAHHAQVTEQEPATSAAVRSTVVES